MPLEFDITQPVSNQKVGTTVGVFGSFSGDAGDPFAVRCTISGDAGYSSTQNGQVDVPAGTWQCTFSGVPAGVYDISAQVASVVGANPVTRVEVVAEQPIELEPPVRAEGGRRAPAFPHRDRSTYRLPVHGTTALGYGLTDGYVVSCYLLLAGAQVSTGGRLTAFYRSGSRHEWRYELLLPGWAWSDAAVLLIELWNVGVEKPEPRPAATIAYPIKVEGRA